MGVVRAFFAAFLFALPAFGSPNKKLNVLVWDWYFDPATLALDNTCGQLGDEFDWDPAFQSSYSGKKYPRRHGMWTTYALIKDFPRVVVHRAYDGFFPWQDPEVCDLTKDGEFAAKLRDHGLPPLPNCRAEMIQRIRDFNRFIREHDIRIVNISHGTYFDRYVQNNPIRMQYKFEKKIDLLAIHKFLYENFMSLHDLIAPIFRENPQTLFVTAAGNNSSDANNRIYPLWDPPDKDSHAYFAPTYFGSFSKEFDNVVNVTSTMDGKTLEEISNWGKFDVDFVKRVDQFLIPSTKNASGWEVYDSTSGAAAQTSRLYIRALLKYGDNPVFTPRVIKELSLKAVAPVEEFAEKIRSGGVLEDEKFEKALKDYASQSSVNAPKALKVIEGHGHFSEFHLPQDLHAANKEMGCHSLTVDQQDRVWATLPWANLIIRFDPRINEFVRFPLGEGVKTPDGISVDSKGRVWAGVDQPGGLVMIDSKTNETRFFQSPQLRTGNITDVDTTGRIWMTSHQARALLSFDVQSQQFEEYRIDTDWPLDVRADQTGNVWVAGMEHLNGFSGPGALVALDLKSRETSYFPISEGQDLTVEWLAPASETVIATSGSGGIYVFDRNSQKLTRMVRSDGKQYYWIVRTPDQSGHVFYLANDHKESQSIDVLNLDHPDQIESFKLTGSNGAIRETLGFDHSGNVWFCKYGTSVIGRMENPL